MEVRELERVQHHPELPLFQTNTQESRWEWVPALGNPGHRGTPLSGSRLKRLKTRQPRDPLS